MVLKTVKKNERRMISSIEKNENFETYMRSFKIVMLFPKTRGDYLLKNRQVRPELHEESFEKESQLIDKIFTF